MTPETLGKANVITRDIKSLESELDSWERDVTAKDVLRQENIPQDAWIDFKRKCKEHLQKLIDKKRAELAAL